MSNSREVYETWSVQAAQRAPLVEFMETALTDAGCTIIQHASPSLAPFRLSFATPWGERHGIVAYAFLANSRVTRNRPADEHRFQLKYGSKDGELHELWQDPYGLYTTLLVGINPDRGLFVGADPVLNSPTRLYISKEFKEAHVGEITRKGWHAWERQQQRKQRVEESQTTEVLVGGKAEAFLKYVLFEREARGEDQGHRHLLADQFGSATLDPLAGSKAIYRALPLLTRERLHVLEREFALSSDQILDLIAERARVHMAVRGGVAERHLDAVLRGFGTVREVEQLRGEGVPDFRVRLRGSRRDVFVECKNAMRTSDRFGNPRLDFQRTRAPKSNPCGRYYRAADFSVLAACLHAHTENWDFAGRLTAEMQAHRTCEGRINSNVVIDGQWDRNLEAVLGRAIA